MSNYEERRNVCSVLQEVLRREPKTCNLVCNEMHINENNAEKCAVDLVGGFGMYQKYSCFVLLSLLTSLTTVTYTSQLISLMTPDHWCRDEHVAALSEQLPLTLEDSKKFSVPTRQQTLSESNGDFYLERTVKFSQCARFSGDMVESYIEWTAAHRPPYFSPSSQKIQPCDQGWVYNLTGYSPTISTQNDWVCNDRWKPYAMQTAFWLNAAVGSFIIAALNHRCSRRHMLIAALVVNLVGGVAALCPSGVLGLLASTSLLGLSFLIVWTIPLLLLVEISGEKYHGAVVSTIVVTNTVAVWCTVWVALRVNDWWHLELIRSSFTLICLLLTYRWLPESPWWLAHTGHNIKTLNIMCFPSDLMESILDDSKEPEVMKADNTAFHPRDFEDSDEQQLLAATENLSGMHPRAHTHSNVIWNICSFGYFSLQHYSTHMISDATDARLTVPDAFVSMWYAALIEVPCWTLPLLLHGRRNRRRWTVLVALTAVAVLCIIYALLSPGYSDVKICCVLLMRMFMTAAFCAVLQHRILLYGEGKQDGNLQEFFTTTGLGGLAIAVTPTVIYLGEINGNIPLLIIGVCSAIIPLAELRNYVKATTITEKPTNNRAHCNVRIASSIPYAKYEFT